MKVNNLLKRIGSVVTTAAMLATLGTTGFAADPTPYVGSLKGDKITITNVKRDDTEKDKGIYGFTISYDSGSAANQNSIGVTMLTYVMKNRDADVSVGTEDNKTAYNPEKMQIVGVNQEKQTDVSGTIKFAVATSENPNGDMVMKPGQKGLVMIGGDNTTPAIAEFSIPAASPTPWTATKLDVTQPSKAPSITVAQLRNTATVKNTVKSLSAFNNMSAKVTSSDGANEAATTVSLTGINNDDITIEPTPENNSTAGDYTAKVAANKLVGDSVESAPEATLALEGNVTFNFKVVKEDFTVTSYALNTTDTDKTVYYQPGANQKQAVIDAIKRGIMISGTVGSETKSQTITDITLGEDKIKINEAGTYEADLSGVTLSSDLYDFTGSADKKITGKLAEDTGNKAVLTVGDAGNKITQVEGTATDFIYSTAAYNAAVSEVENEIAGAVSLKKADNTALVKDTDYTLGWSGIDVKNLIATVEEAKLKITLKNSLVFADGSTEKTLKFKINVAAEPAEAFTAKSFGAVDKEVSVGTAKADVISSLPTTATAYENADKTGTSATVNVENWTSSDYDASKIGEYTFTATVPVQTQEGVVKVTEAGTVSVKVTTKAITVDATKTVAVNVPVGYTAETVANALPAKLTYTNDTLTDIVDVTWNAIDAADLGKADGATFTVTGTVANASDNRLFNFDPKVVTATVTVRNSVESNKAWELGNTGEYNAGTVKVYLPTTAKKDDVVIATLYKADGTTLAGATATVTLTSDYNADTYNSVDLTFDNSFNAVGIHANDSYIVKVTVNNTPLTYTVGEGETATSKDFVQGTVYPTTSRRPSTGGGSTTPEVKSYNVSVKADNNGKATVNKSKATAGETVAVNVEPNEGYKVKEITVKDVNGKSIDVDQKTRTFEMPEGAVTVTVTFEEGTEEPTPDDKGKFKDVPDSFWAAADIYTLREAGIIDGKTADEFDPEGQVTRAEFTKMIVKTFGVEAKDTKVEFADCGEDDWFTPFVAAAVEAGYVKGYSDTEFAPDRVISREEACAILGRAYAKAANSELSFTDKDSIDEYAQPYVALLVEMGFINGYEDGTFRAQNQITRAEAAKIIGCAYRLATASK